MDGSFLPSPWGSPSGRAAFWAILLLVLFLLLLPLSQATGQGTLPTTQLAVPSSESLLSLVDTIISSSMNTDEKLTYFEEQLKQERTQRQNDNADRLKEIASWQGISETLASQVTTQQSYLSDFGSRLGSFSGSDQERHDAQVKALDSIEAGVKALELKNKILTGLAIGGGVATLVAIIVAIVK